MKTQDIKNMAAAMQQVAENSKAAMQKKLAKAAASSEKGKAAVTLPKAPFEIPEDIPANERTAFHGAAAAAHKAGKSHFTMNGKKYPVTMKKDAATAINEPQGQAKRMMSPLQKMRMDKEKADRDRDGKLKPRPKMKKEEVEIEEAAYLKGSIENRADAHEDQADHHNAQAEKAHKAGDKTAASAHKAAARAHMKAASYFDKHLSKPKHLRPQAAGGATSQAAHAATQKANQYNESVEQIDEISMGKLQNYSKAAMKDIENKRNVVKKAMSTGKKKDYDDAQKAVAGLGRRSKGSDMYTDKMTGRSKVKPTAEQDEVVMNPKEKKKDKENMAMESTRWPVLARILENRAAHYKSATDAEKMSDKFKGKGAKDAAASVGMDTDRSAEADANTAAADTAKAATDKVKKAAARRGDNQTGDKAIVKPGTEVKQ